MTKEEKIQIIQNGFSINDVSLKIYGYTNGSSIDRIKRFINDNNIDTSHFDTKNKNRKYDIVLKKCPICENEFETKLNHKKEKTTCSFSCANRYFKNKKSESEKQKISESLKKYYKENDDIKNNKSRTYTRICVICNNEFRRWRIKNGYLTTSKTCSKECYNKQKSINSKKSITERIEKGIHKGWISRNKISYPEKFFIKVLKNNKIFEDCKVNYKISKSSLGIECHSNYFLDFYFEDKKLDLEIDGKQHNLEERKESDKIRDEYLTKNGIIVYRIKWKSINSERGKKYIESEINKFMNFYNSI